MTHLLPIVAIVSALMSNNAIAEVDISDESMRAIGQRVWHNEGSGRIDRLTWWNKGEQFASLGIAHFIWYPKGYEGPFEESFPTLLDFLREHGVNLPAWLTVADPDCPWATRDDFLNASDSPRMLQLRRLLEETIDHQSRYLVDRLKQRWPIIRAASQSQTAIDARFHALIQTASGQYALVDYINFKGDGTKLTERYANQGWGLLQVLETMQDADTDVSHQFADAAAQVLKQRVMNSPAARNEQRWLKGWLHRVTSYRDVW